MLPQRPRICADCGYELVGRSLQGQCPECGRYWNVTTGEGLEAEGATRRARADRLVNRLRTIALSVAALAMLSCGGGFSYFAHAAGGNAWRPLAIAGVVAAVLVLAAVTSYVYEDE